MASLKKAVIEKCKQCTYDPAAPGTYLMQIEQCTVKSCPLWEVRPVSNATIQIRRHEKTGGDDQLASLIDGLEDEAVA